MIDIVIKNGNIVSPERILRGSICIKDGKISEILSDGEERQAKQVIDASGKYVFPGFIDTHAHLNEPGYEWREDYEHGTAAAAAGGFTTVIDMPIQNEPALVDEKSFDNKISSVKDSAYIDYALWGGMIPENIEDLKGQNDKGCVAFKSFVSPTAPGFSPLNYGQVYEAMKVVKEFGGRAGFHCEDFAMINWLESKMKKDGKTDWRGYLESRPVAAEMVATVAVIELAKSTGCKTHICHVSSPDVAQKIKEAQKEGYDITAETCPHYLMMTKEDLINNGALYKCAPPLRSREDMEKLWDYVIDGTFSGIGSDHSPATYDEKYVEIDGKPIKNAFDPWGGMSGLQTVVQSVFYEGCIKRNISPVILADVMSKKAAKAFGLYGRKGDIKPGFDADIVILDPDKEWEITSDSLYYLNKISSFIGRKGKGMPTMTMVRGNIIAKDGQIVGKKGYGRLVTKVYAD